MVAELAELGLVEVEPVIKFEMDLPLWDRLAVDLKRAVKKGGKLGAKLVKERTKAGKDADGKALPGAEPGRTRDASGRFLASDRERSLYRSGETVESVDAFAAKGLAVNIRPDGYHSGGKAAKAIKAIERSGKKLTAAAKRRIQKAAGKANQKKRADKGRSGRARPLPLIMYAQQAGAVGGKKAGAREPFDVMKLNEVEETKVHQAIDDDVAEQIENGPGIDFRRVKKILMGGA